MELGSGRPTLHPHSVFICCVTLNSGAPSQPGSLPLTLGPEDWAGGGTEWYPAPGPSMGGPSAL